uniref:Uncharacterized protein n=1 Tax=Brugia timori TaxID=42155 RepID=A0A0R3R6F3_9BILA
LASIASDSIMQCNTLMPRMKNDLKSIHLCYIIIIIISILLCILLAISNLSKWILEGINEKQYIEEMKVGKANLEKRTKIFEQAKDEK